MSLSRQGTLAQQTSQVFQMTLDELQSSFAGSGKIGSMNLEDFLAQVWDHHGGNSGAQGETGTVQPNLNNAPSMNNGSADYSGKTVEEVWQAIQAGKGQNGEPFNSVNLGSFLQSVGVDMPPAVSTELFMTNLSMPSEKSMQMDTMRMPEEAQMPLIVPQQSAAAPSGGMYFQDCNPHPSEEYRDNRPHASATVQAAPKFDASKTGRSKKKNDLPYMMTGSPQPPPQPQRRARKRKDPEVVDEKTARQQKRMVKNRESAARSRLRKQEYTAQLEVQIAMLKDENRTLLEKIVRSCPATPPQQGPNAPLRRLRTMPSPNFKKLVEEAVPSKTGSDIPAEDIVPKENNKDGAVQQS